MFASCCIRFKYSLKNQNCLVIIAVLCFQKRYPARSDPTKMFYYDKGSYKKSLSFHLEEASLGAC